MVFAAYFLLLYAGVGFLQDKRFFGSAPKENLDAIPDRKERFLGILYAMEVYDIVFFDWVLLCHSNFFPHFYPELKGIVGPQQFGCNKTSHLRHFALYLPASALAAWLCTLL